jgi:hypothetical protein
MMTPETKAKLKAARVTALANGQSPRQIGQAKAWTAVHWIYRWGWASPSVLELVCRDNRNGLVSRLLKRGLIIKTRTESGGGQRDVPTYLLTLTEAGVNEVERMIEEPSDLLPYSTDPYRIKQALLRHDILAQMATVKALLKGTITSFSTEREMAAKSEAGVKQPDVMWWHGDTRIAVEIELSAKWERDLDEFVGRYLLALAPRNGVPARCHQIALISDSPAILKRYKAAFAPGASYGSDSRHWRRVGEQKVPEWIGGRVLCQHI